MLPTISSSLVRARVRRPGLAVWVGLGVVELLAIDAIRERDYPAIQGTNLFVALPFVLVNVLTGLLYSAVNPRIRLD